MIELLLSKGANVSIVNVEKETPLHVACRRAPSLFSNSMLPTDANHVWQLLRKLKIVSDDKQTMKAGLSSSWAAVDVLLKAGGDANQGLNKDHKTAKQLAPFSLRIAIDLNCVGQMASFRHVLGLE